MHTMWLHTQHHGTYSRQQLAASADQAMDPKVAHSRQMHGEADTWQPGGHRVDERCKFVCKWSLAKCNSCHIIYGVKVVLFSAIRWRFDVIVSTKRSCGNLSVISEICEWIFANYIHSNASTVPTVGWWQCTDRSQPQKRSTRTSISLGDISKPTHLNSTQFAIEYDML